MKYRFYLSLFIALLWVQVALSGDAGKNGMSFLKLPVDGRSAAMGGAGVALSTDASAIFYNPAGLAATDTNHLILTHQAGLLDIVQEFAAVRFALGTHHLAFSVNVFNVPGVEVRGEEPTTEPNGSTDMLNFYGSIAYARTIRNDWQLGLNLKYLYEKLYLNSASGWALDVGIRRTHLLKNFHWGFVLRNLGSMSRLKDEATQLPLIVSTGLVYSIPLHFSPLVAADYEYIRDETSALRLGLEWPLLPALAIRMGTHMTSEQVNWTAGLGFHFQQVEVQYGFVSDAYSLGAAHRFTIGYVF